MCIFSLFQQFFPPEMVAFPQEDDRGTLADAESVLRVRERKIFSPHFFLFMRKIYISYNFPFLFSALFIS